jgi:hypothetical protein
MTGLEAGAVESHPNAPRVHATEFNDMIVTEGYTEKKKKRKIYYFWLRVLITAR